MSALTQLPYFHADPPLTLGALEWGLRLSLGDVVDELNDRGSFYAPRLVGGVREPLSALVDGLSARYWWSMYHNRPYRSMDEIRAARLEEYEILFRDEMAACESWLAARHGAPYSVIGPSQDGLLYGNYLIGPRKNGGFALAWYDSLPDWARPAADEDARLQFLAELPRALVGASYEEVARFMSSPPPTAGIVVTGSLNPGDFWLELAPAQRALDVAAAFGIPGLVGRSSDVHLSSWRLAVARDGAVLDLVFGDWVLDVGLVARPSGAAVPGHHARNLGDGDQARSLCVRRRRR